MESLNNPWVMGAIILAFVWALPWKGIALWKSARNSHLVWFIVIMIVNTLGILEIIYIFVFSKKAQTMKETDAV